MTERLVDYATLPGEPQQPTAPPFGASAARASGTEYLEIDLGTVQPVNFISFEATSKPYQIDAAYVLLDQAPQRSFTPVTLVSPFPKYRSFGD